MEEMTQQSSAELPAHHNTSCYMGVRVNIWVGAAMSTVQHSTVQYSAVQE